MLVPHILFINLTGEKKSAYAQQRSQRSRSIRTWIIIVFLLSMIRTFRNQDGRTWTGRWKTGSYHPCFDGFGANFWTLLPNSLHSFNHNKDRDDVYPLNCREQEQDFYFFLSFPTSICNPFLRWFHFNNGKLAEKVSAVLSFR